MEFLICLAIAIGLERAWAYGWVMAVVKWMLPKSMFNPVPKFKQDNTAAFDDDDDDDEDYL